MARRRDPHPAPVEGPPGPEYLPPNVRNYLATNNLGTVHNYPDGNCFHSSLAAHPELFPEVFRNEARPSDVRNLLLGHIEKSKNRATLIDSLELPSNSKAFAFFTGAEYRNWGEYKSGLGRNGLPSDSTDFHVAASLMRSLTPQRFLFIITLAA